MILAALAGCIPQIGTAQGQLTVSAADLSAIADASGTAALLAGTTTTCPTLSCASENCPTASNALECFQLGATDSATYDSGCFAIGDPGTASFTFDPIPCAANGEGYAPVPDHLTFDVVDPADVTAGVIDLEGLLAPVLSPGDDGSAFPDDWQQPEGTPWALVAGSGFTFRPQLLQGTDPVGFTLALGSVEVASGTGPSPTLTNAPGTVVVTAQEGGAADLALRVVGDTWPMVSILGVPATDAATVSVVVGYYRDPTTTELTPVGARAVVRNGNGQLLWALPVAWTLDDGLLALQDDALPVPGPDYTALEDHCVAPSANAGPHTAIVRASYGSLTATATLSWTVPEGQSDTGWTANPSCVEGTPHTTPSTPSTPTTPVSDPTTTTSGSAVADDTGVKGDGGCGCDESGGRWSWLGLALLALVRRRR